MGIFKKADIAARETVTSATTGDSRSASGEIEAESKHANTLGLVLSPEYSLTCGDVERVKYVTMEWWQVGARKASHSTSSNEFAHM